MGGRSLWVVQGLCQLRVLASPLQMGMMGPPNAPQLTFSRTESETRPWGPGTSAPVLDATFLVTLGASRHCWGQKNMFQRVMAPTSVLALLPASPTQI